MYIKRLRLIHTLRVHAPNLFIIVRTNLSRWVTQLLVVRITFFLRDIFMVVGDGNLVAVTRHILRSLGQPQQSFCRCCLCIFMRDRHCRIVGLSIADKRLEIATCKTDSFPRVGRFLHSSPHARKPLKNRGCHLMAVVIIQILYLINSSDTQCNRGIKRFQYLMIGKLIISWL